MSPTDLRDTMDAVSPVARYLNELDGALVGPARVRRDLVREAAGHLEDATEAHQARGLGAHPAAERAVAEFGTVAEVAPGFQTTLAIASARRTAWLLVAVLIVQPFLWDGGLAGSAMPGTPGGPWYTLLDRVVEATGGVLVVTAVFLLVATGVGTRWHDAGRPLAVATAAFGLLAAAVMSGISLAMTALGVGPHPAGWLLTVSLVVVPMAVIATSARRTLATC